MKPEEKLFADYVRLMQAGQTVAALAALEKAVKQAPRFAQGWYHLAGARQKRNDLPGALAAMEQACASEPQNGDYWLFAANLKQDNGDLSGALAHLRQSIQVRPGHAPTYNNMGIVLSDLGRLEEAERAFREAIRLDPNYARAYANLGSTLSRLYRFAEAMVPLKRALAINPQYAHAWFSLGSALFQSGMATEGEAALRRSVQLNPALSKAFAVLGKLYQEQGKLDAAEAAIREAVRTQPDSTKELNQLGDLLIEQGRYQEADECFQQVLRNHPDNLAASLRAALTLPSVYDHAEHVEHMRAQYATRLSHLTGRLNAFSGMSHDDLMSEIQFNNFFLAYQGRDDRELQRQFAQFVEQLLQPRVPQLYEPLHPQPCVGRRIRVGFASGFFFHCTVGHYFESWVNGLDRTQFEIFVYYTNRSRDFVTDGIAAHSDHFLHNALPVSGLAQRIRDDKLDILVYPELGMDGMMFPLASMRLAPVQCCGWGHPVTTGHRNMDYFLSCQLMEPADAEEHYSEQLVRLPGIGTHYTAPTRITNKSRADYQLPENKTLYFYPQSLFKLHPDNDELVAEVLSRDADGVLVMSEGRHPRITRQFMARLTPVFERYGLKIADRINILPNLMHEDYLRVNQLCDLMLDSLYWSGGNTSLDALSTGLPIVTLPGEFMRGRQSMGMLTALSVPELIARGRADYIDIAERVGKDRDYRKMLSQRILANRLQLFEDKLPVEALQDFFKRVVRQA